MFKMRARARNDGVEGHAQLTTSARGTWKVNGGLRVYSERIRIDILGIERYVDAMRKTKCLITFLRFVKFGSV